MTSEITLFSYTFHFWALEPQHPSGSVFGMNPILKYSSVGKVNLKGIPSFAQIYQEHWRISNTLSKRMKSSFLAYRHSQQLPNCTPNSTFTPGQSAFPCSFQSPWSSGSAHYRRPKSFTFLSLLYTSLSTLTLSSQPHSPISASPKPKEPVLGNQSLPKQKLSQTFYFGQMWGGEKN